MDFFYMVLFATFRIRLQFQRVYYATWPVFNLFMLYIQKNQEKNARVTVVRPDTERELCF